MKIILFICSCLVLSSICAQKQVSFGQLSIKDGLSQNCGVSIAQDSTGYLWIATQDGLNKFDGNDFVVYPFIFDDITRPSYSNLGKVYVDRKNQVWCIPSSRKLNKLNAKTNQFEALPITTDANVIFQDESLNYWIGTHANGLLSGQMNDGLFSVRNIGAIKETINAISQLDSLLLVATDKGIISVDIYQQTLADTLNRTTDHALIQHKFSTIATDVGGRQWFGTYGGGLYYRNDKEKYLSAITNLSWDIELPADLNILSLFVDSKNRLWIGTYGQGLYLIDLDSYETSHFMADKYNPKAIHYNDILDIYEDYTGTLWFGTDGAGLSYYDEYLEKFNSITNYQVPQDINVDVVRAITTDTAASVWIGTSGKGLMQYIPENKSWTKYSTLGPKDARLLSNRIMSLYADQDNELWIGTQGGGLSILNNSGRITNFLDEKESGLEAITIWDIFEDSGQRHWLATRENGLIEIDKKRGMLRAYNEDNSEENLKISNNIRVIAEDSQGKLWLGTDSQGLIVLDLSENISTSFKYIQDENSLSNNMIKSLYYSMDDNVLWIGTYGGGLNAYDVNNDHFYVYTENDGLANNVIYAVLPDDQGNLWLSSNSGITKFKPGLSLEDPPEIINYNNYEGLATEFNTGAYHLDNEGYLYFGGLEGYYWFKPSEIQENNQLPKTAITGMQVANTPYKMAPGTILSHNQNTFSFTFSSLQYSLPEKNQYRYRLINYDDDWIAAGNSNFARYSHLEPGDYEFWVISSNYDGVWNPEPATFAFTIAQPWYYTSLAKGLYLLLILVGIYAVYAYLKWRWRMKLNLQLKEEEALRLKKLDNFKSKLYADISHEFRTPLTLIAGPVDAKLSQGGLNSTDYGNFSMIKRNTNRLLALVDQLLHLAKLEKGRLKLKVAKGDLGLFLKMLAVSFQYRATSKDINYSMEISELNDVWFDEDAVEKIVSNLLSNAFKYCPEGGKVNFDVHSTASFVQLNFRNTVAHISEKNLDQIFNRFYQLDEYTDGVGIGLSLVKQLVELYGGEVSVKLDGPKDIHFKVQLPVSQNSFSEDQRIESNNTIAIDNDTANDTVPRGDSMETGKQEIPILLVVEDHYEVRQFLIKAWKDKYRIFEASDGKTGIEEALKIIPDLIISDISMPNMSGIELCNALKADERTSHVPIILLTGNIGEEEELKGLQSGADDFVTKPFKLPILEKRVQNLIASRIALRDRYSQEVIIKAKEIAITPADQIFLEKIQKVMDSQLSDTTFNAIKFAEAIGMSRMQLHRKLSAMTGLSTTEFIRSQRLIQAMHILKTSDITINEVAYAVGFNTPSYFIKCFKETYNKTPSEFLQDF